MADTNVKSILDEESQKSYRVVDGDFNPMDDGPMPSSPGGITRTGTIDNEHQRHRRHVSSLEENGMDPVDEEQVQEHQIRDLEKDNMEKAMRNTHTDVNSKGGSMALTYHTSMKQMKQTAGDGRGFLNNRNYQSDIFAGSQSFASGPFNKSSMFSGEKDIQYILDANQVADGGTTPSNIARGGAKPLLGYENSTGKRTEDRHVPVKASGQPYLRKEPTRTSSKFLKNPFPRNSHSSQGAVALDAQPVGRKSQAPAKSQFGSPYLQYEVIKAQI